MLHPGRYTRWVNVTMDGTPFWSQVVSEELYDEVDAVPGSPDDFDTSETANLAAHPDQAGRLASYRQLLLQHFQSGNETDVEGL